MQAQGEVFTQWWETKLRKAKKCAMKKMTSDNWLKLELIQGVSDRMLQKKLLQEKTPTLKQLVSIAQQWQAADSAQASFGTEAAEFVRQTHTEEKREEEMEYHIWKAFNYKKEEWMMDRQQNDRRMPNIDRCQGCGAQGEQMHNRGACPTIDKDCFRCCIKGHFGQVCKKPRPSQPQPRNVQKMVRLAEIHRGGGADPTPMMENIRIFPRDGGKKFTFKMCPDTGCTMTLIAENVEARQGMTMDTRSWKRVRAVNGQRLNNSGTVVFGIEYQGQTTEVEALVSLSIEGKVLLSWQIL